jgi:hypothetical protein
MYLLRYFSLPRDSFFSPFHIGTILLFESCFEYIWWQVKLVKVPYSKIVDLMVAGQACEVQGAKHCCRHLS